jgi:hypothetical protein
MDRDLEEMVHGEDRVEAGALGGDGDLRRPLEDLIVANAGVLEVWQIEAEEWHGIPLAVRRRGSISGGAQAPLRPHCQGPRRCRSRREGLAFASIADNDGRPYDLRLP